MKKVVIIIITLLLCGCSIFITANQTARAADQEITLNYEDIAARVAGYNSTVRIGKISLSEAQSALSQAQSANRDRREQRASLNEAISETTDMIENGALDDTALKEAQTLLSTLEQMSDSLRNQNTSQLERTIEAVTLQNAQSLDQLINGARQLFIRAWQLQLNINLQLSKVEQAKLEVGKAEIRLAHGLGTSAALSEAQLQVFSASTELAALERQLQVMLDQLRDYFGYKPETTVKLGEAPELDDDYLAEIDIEQDAAAAVSANFALKLLNIDRINANSSSAKRKITIQIEQQEAAVKQAVEQKYQVLLETQTKLDLAAAELAQAAQQLAAAQTHFDLGRIAKNTLDKQQATWEAKQTSWQNAVLALIAELEDYLAKVGGLS